MDKMKRAQSSTGVVHYIIENRPGKGRLVVPFCDGQINGVFINWKFWSLTNGPVTCKHCLRKAGEKLYPAKVVASGLFGDHSSLREFATKKELDAYTQGLEDAVGWNHIRINDHRIIIMDK